MKRVVLLLSAILCLCEGGLCQSKQSDDLFARGVKLYKLGKFQKAIPLFAQCDSLDRHEMDSTNNRIGYAKHWLSSCYFHIGDTTTSASLHAAYYTPPVDRRLTIESDSAAYWGNYYYSKRNYAEALKWFDKCRELETAIIGENHYFVANDFMDLGNTKLNLGDTVTAAKYFGKAADILFASLGMRSESTYGAASSASYVSMWVGDFSTAKKYMLKAMECRRLLSGTDNDAYLKLIADYDYALNQLKDWKSAADIRKEEVAIRERMAGKENKDYLCALNYYAVYAFRSGQYDVSARGLLEAIPLQEKVLGPYHPSVLTNLNNLLQTYSKMGNVDGVMSVAEDILPILDYVEKEGLIAKYKIKEGENMDARKFLYTNYQRGENYEKALHYAQEYRDLLAQKKGTETEAYGEVLKDIGSMLNRMGRYDEALHTDSLALDLYSRLKGLENIETLVVLSNISVAQFCANHQDEALRTAERLLELRRKVAGANSDDVAFTLSNLANMFAEAGNFERGIELGEQSLTIYLQLSGDTSDASKAQHKNLSLMYSFYGQSLAKQLKSAEADLAYDKALHHAEKCYGAHSTQCADILYSRAISEYKLGYKTMAVAHTKEALSIYEQVEGGKSAKCADMLSDLTFMYGEMNDMASYVHYAEQSYATHEQVYGLENAKTATAMMKLGRAYYYCGDKRFQQSDSLYRRALALTRQTAGPRSPEYARALQDYLENLNVENWDESKKIEVLEEAVDILEENYGKDAEQTASPLNLMAGYCAIKGDYKKSVQIFEKLLRMKKQKEDCTTDELILMGKNLCYALYYDRQNDRICNYATEVTQQLEDQVLRSFSTMTEHERNLYWRDHSDWFHNSVMSYARASDSDSLKIMAYNALLFGKGLLLNTETRLQQYIMQGGDSVSVTHWNRLNGLRNQLEALQSPMTAVQGERKAQLDREYHFADSISTSLFADYLTIYRLCPDDSVKKATSYAAYALAKEKTDSIGAYIRQMMMSSLGGDLKKAAALQQQIDDEERQLVTYVNRMADFLRPEDVDYEDVLAHLPPRSAAVEFVCFEDSFHLEKDGTGSPYTVTSAAYYALVVKHGEKSPVFIRLADKKVMESMTIDSVFASSHLGEYVWQPLQKVLADVCDVYFSPIEPFNTLPIEYMPEASQWNLYRLSSTRELVLHSKSESMKRAVLYGGVRYDLTDYVQTNASQMTDRGARAATLSIPELPGTLTEVEMVGKLMATKHLDVEERKENIATESSLKSLSGTSVNLLHVSTHGFYNNNYLSKADYSHYVFSESSDQLNRTLSVEEAMLRQRDEDQMLLRSGLLMAGAANYLFDEERSMDAGEDGILTAREIARLDFSHVRLVALSACETALGGLQIAFKKAGAQSILMSLWKVDDEATCLLMTEFYKNWIGEGKNKHDALELAKQYVRSHKEKGWDNPKYWAAFILLDALD